MFLGVDLGTSSIKLLLADGDGQLLSSASEEYPLHIFNGNWSEQNPEDWWTGFCNAVKKLSEKFDLTKIEGVSFSGQMHGLVLLDKNDKVIRPALLWNDGRTVEECKFLNDEIGREKLIAWTGNVALTGFTAPKVLWVRNNEPLNFNKIAKIMLPKDYLSYKLTGVFATDVSDASGTLYFDVKNKCWSKDMLNILKIDERQLPEIHESVDVVGFVSQEVANALGLSTKTKVIIGGGDQAMGAIGTGTVLDEQVSIQLGTSGVIFINAKNYAEQSNGELHSFCNANGEFHLMGVTLACAGSTKWWVEDVLQQNDYGKVFEKIDKMPIDDLLFLPYMMGERSPINDPYAKGTFYGLTLSHSQKEITKAIVEGICFSLKDCLNSAKKCGINPKFARVIGGGTKSAEWLQILSDILEIELKTINTSEGGGLGAIILAMTACGKFESVNDACDHLIKDHKSYIPRSENFAKYEEKFNKYLNLYSATKTLN